MRSFLLAVATVAAWGGAITRAEAAPARMERQCAALAERGLGPDARIVSAALERKVPSVPDINWAAPVGRGSGQARAPFCKVVVTSMPSRTSRIRVEVWLPTTNWNGKMLGVGNGGYPMSLDYQGMAAGLARHFAVVGTDLGLAAYLPDGKLGQGDDITRVFIGNPVAIRDFATRATHEMTKIGKTLVQAFYGKPATWSYFAGCSTGGMQAMSESQRYPADYDGILAGAPGGDRARVHLVILWNFMAVWQRPASVIPPEKLQLLHAAAVADCVAQEGGPSGKRYIEHPEECRWKPDPLLCEGDDGPACLTRPQLAAARAIYEGPHNPRTGERYLHGLLPGSEPGWAMYMQASAREQIPFFGIFAAALGAQASPVDFDWDRDARTFIDVMGPQLDSTSPDLSAFAERGGKMLIYQGGSDAFVSLTDIQAYHAAVVSRLRAQGRDASVRLLALPGMDHCRGGDGITDFDGLGQLQSWVEVDRP